MPRTTKTWGIGIEHELFVTTDKKGNKFKKHIEGRIRGGYGRGSNVFTTEGRVLPPGGSELLHRGEKIIGAIGRDPTVGQRDDGYEISTKGPEKKTVKKQLKKIRKIENFLISHAPNSSLRRSVFPFGTQGEKGVSMGDRTPGSYHLHFTFPHNETNGRISPREQEKINRDYTIFLKQFQWVEPLILACVGGASPQSVGDAGLEPEGSVRLTRCSYGGMGTKTPDWTDPRIASKYGTEFTPTYKKDSGIPNYSGGHSPDFMKKGKAWLEIRYLDSFDSRKLGDFMRTILYLASNAIDREDAPEPSKIAANSEVWNKAATRVLQEGYNAYLPEEYIKKLRKNLGLKIKTKLPNDRRAYIIMGQINKELYKKNKSNDIPEKMIEDRTRPDVHVINRDAWDYWFRRKMRIKLEEREKFKKTMVALSEIITHPQSKAKYIDAGTKNVGFKHLVKYILGEEYSSEDHRDIIDFMEQNNLLKVKRNKDGSIKNVSPTYEKENIDKKLKKIVYDKRFLSTDPKDIIRPDSEFYGGGTVKFKSGGRYKYGQIKSKKWSTRDEGWRYKVRTISGEIEEKGEGELKHTPLREWQEKVDEYMRRAHPLKFKGGDYVKVESGRQNIYFYGKVKGEGVWRMDESKWQYEFEYHPALSRNTIMILENKMEKSSKEEYELMNPKFKAGNYVKWKESGRVEYGVVISRESWGGKENKWNYSCKDKRGEVIIIRQKQLKKTIKQKYEDAQRRWERERVERSREEHPPKFRVGDYVKDSRDSQAKILSANFEEVNLKWRYKLKLGTGRTLEGVPQDILSRSTRAAFKRSARRHQPSERPHPKFNTGGYAKFKWQTRWRYCYITGKEWDASNDQWKYIYKNPKGSRELVIEENLQPSSRREFERARRRYQEQERRQQEGERRQRERRVEITEREPRERVDSEGRVITNNINLAASNPSHYVFRERKGQPGWFRQSRKHREARFKALSNQRKKWRKKWRKNKNATI